MTKWEYMTTRRKASAAAEAEVLNELGQQQWELVAVTGATLYFKRPYVAHRAQPPK